MNTIEYKGIVFGFPEHENSSFCLEFVTFLTSGKEAEDLSDPTLDSLRKAITDTGDTLYLSYVGDMSETFEMYIESDAFTDELEKAGLTYVCGEIDSWGGGIKKEGDTCVWSPEVKALLDYVQSKYRLCSETFLRDGGYYDMCEQEERS